MAKSKALTEDALASIVNAQINDADLFDGADRDGINELALRFWEGEVDIPAMGEGRSSVVSRDVSDTHGIILPGLMRTFFSSDRVVIFEPTKAVHEDYADLATDYVNYVVMRESNGFREFRNALWDGLLLGNGIMKFWWDDTPEYDIVEFSELDDEQFALLKSQMGEDDEILSEASYPADESGEDDEGDADAVVPEDGEVLIDGPAEPEDGDDADEAGFDAPEPVMPPMGDVDPAAAQMPMDPMQAIVGALAGGMPMPAQRPMLHDIKIRRLTTSGRLRLRCIPGEDLLLDRTATVIDEKIRFIAHKYTATRSDLVEDGYDKETVEALPSHENIDSSEDSIRDRYSWSFDTAPDASTELIDVFECYVLVDADGDGVAERRRVIMAGSEGARRMLLDEPWSDDVPFADIVPEPRPHTWRGRGLYEKVGDLQRQKTVAWRGVLDNLYSILAPMREVEENAYVNMDALYNPQFNEVLIRRAGKQPMQPLTQEFIAPSVIPLLDQIDMVAEKRTGVSVRAQSQNADALQNQSATSASIAQSALHAKIDEYAQNIAQCGGMARIFKCILKLFVSHQDRARKLRIAGKEIKIDPRAWDAGMDVTINTGLGTGNRDRDVQALQIVANEQKAVIMQFGDPYNPILNVGHLFDTLRKLAEATGLRNADAHFPVITQEDIQGLAAQRAQASQGQQDPKMMDAQAKLQIEQAKIQQQAQSQQAKFQMDAQERAARVQMDETKMVREFEFRQMEAAAKRQADAENIAKELTLKREQMEVETQLRIRQMDAELALKRELEIARIQMGQASNPAPTSSPIQMGGELG